MILHMCTKNQHNLYSQTKMTSEISFFVISSFVLDFPKSLQYIFTWPLAPHLFPIAVDDSEVSFLTLGSQCTLVDNV